MSATTLKKRVQFLFNSLSLIAIEGGEDRIISEVNSFCLLSFHNGITIKHESMLKLIEFSSVKKIRHVSEDMEMVTSCDQTSKAQLFNLEFV